MRVFKEILLAAALTLGMSLMVAAQKDGQRPPKGDPPRVDPGKKPPPSNPPKGGDKPPKKPGYAMEFAIVAKSRSDAA